MHSPLDDTVDIGNATAIFQAAHHPKSFVSLDDADHLLTRVADANYTAEIIAAWATRYLDGETPMRNAQDRGQVVAEETGGGGFQVDVRPGAVASGSRDTTGRK